MTELEVRDLIESLTLLATNYNGQRHGSEYLRGFRNGARSAYSDVIARLRELLADAA